MKSKLLISVALAFAMSAGLAQAAPSAAVVAAVADKGRPAADVARDVNRKPAEMLELAGVKPGDKVAELLPGQGYFTRLLAGVVGPQGKVYAAVPSGDLAKAKASATAANVMPVAYTGPGFTTPEPVDVIFTAQNFHDLYLKQLNLDVPATIGALYKALKPGGVLLVIDHTAVDGAPIEVADTLHRIDPAKARAAIEAAGFKFEGESNAVRNPADDKTKSAFDPSIRGKTDQFVHKFRKPK